MSNIKELTRAEIQEKFEEIFRQHIASDLSGESWNQADVIFREGKASNNFADVEFLMASHQSGASLLYTSQSQGNSIYSVVGNGTKVSFSVRVRA